MSRDEIRCGSGQFIDQRHRCMYDVNALGDVLGCRDVTHLEQCGEFSVFCYTWWFSYNDMDSTQK